MNKRLHKANTLRNEAAKAMHEASDALTRAINATDYGTDSYRVAVEQARDTHYAAVLAYNEAHDAYHAIADEPVYQLLCRDGWALAPSFKMYVYDDSNDFLDALRDAMEEMKALVAEGKLPRTASITAVLPSGTRVTWDCDGKLVKR